MGAQIGKNFAVCRRAIVIIGVDHGKGRIDLLLRAQNGVCRAPRLHTAFGQGVALRQHIHLLKRIADLHAAFFGAAAHRGLKVGLDLVLDDKYNGFKPGAAGIVQAVIQNCLAVAAHRVDLLQAAVAAAHTGGHHYQDRFFICHKSVPPGGRTPAAFLWQQRRIFLCGAAFVTITITLFSAHSKAEKNVLY